MDRGNSTGTVAAVNPGGGAGDVPGVTHLALL